MSNKGVVKVILGDNVYECLCTYSPETPDTMYRSNGDPGDPGDPEEFELLEVRLAFSPTVKVDILPWLQDLDAEGIPNPLDRIADKALELAREPIDDDFPEPDVSLLSWEESGFGGPG